MSIAAACLLLTAPAIVRPGDAPPPTPPAFPLQWPSAPADENSCSQSWCTSPTEGDDGEDCWAGSPQEACTCSNGAAVTTGDTTYWEGTKYYEYTCCLEGGEGEECGDYSVIGRILGGVLLGLGIAFIGCAVGVCVIACLRKKRREQAQLRNAGIGTAGNAHRPALVATAVAVPVPSYAPSVPTVVEGVAISGPPPGGAPPVYGTAVALPPGGAPVVGAQVVSNRGSAVAVA